MLKVMTIVGTRPELIKMSRVISELDKHTNHILVHTGQNYDYELNQVFFQDLEIRKPDYFLNSAGSNAAQTIAKVIAKTDEVLEQESPDAVMLYGDTNSCLAVLPAKRRKIPIFHMEAGNRCFDQRVPEEINRKVVDHLSDVNMVLTEHARRYLLAEGIRPDTVFKTGSHMPEVLDYYLPKIRQSNILTKLGLEPRKYFLISTHREENVDSPQMLRSFLETLNSLVVEYDFPIIVSTHPRTRKRLESLDQNYWNNNKRVIFSNPFGFLDYIQLQMHTFCILSDSGTITEESSLLNLPAITIRKAHERPEGMDSGILIMSEITASKVLDAVRVVTSQFSASPQPILDVIDYRNHHVSKQIVRIVLSYVDYINRVIWHKDEEGPTQSTN